MSDTTITVRLPQEDKALLMITGKARASIIKHPVRWIDQKLFLVVVNGARRQFSHLTIKVKLHIVS